MTERERRCRRRGRCGSDRVYAALNEGQARSVPSCGLLPAFSPAGYFRFACSSGSGKLKSSPPARAAATRSSRGRSGTLDHTDDRQGITGRRTRPATWRRRTRGGPAGFGAGRGRGERVAYQERALRRWPGPRPSSPEGDIVSLPGRSAAVPGSFAHSWPACAGAPSAPVNARLPILPWPWNGKGALRLRLPGTPFRLAPPGDGCGSVARGE